MKFHLSATLVCLLGSLPHLTLAWPTENGVTLSSPASGNSSVHTLPKRSFKISIDECMSHPGYAFVCCDHGRHSIYYNQGCLNAASRDVHPREPGRCEKRGRNHGPYCVLPGLETIWKLKDHHSAKVKQIVGKYQARSLKEAQLEGMLASAIAACTNAYGGRPDAEKSKACLKSVVDRW
ncbi:hypothetical protein FKW77_003209 [Venturia effusa]|uniref:Uncharacterized protein n=1 Tax=Venturia effusa TaxID=50376 RepID=A0A517LC66_9PEZI|nr:hypothetical protein FKW77_003209 [Venturia effusa]